MGKSGAQEAAEHFAERARGYLAGHIRDSALSRAKRLRTEDRQRREYERFILALNERYGGCVIPGIRAMQAKITKRRKVK